MHCSCVKTISHTSSLNLETLSDLLTLHNTLLNPTNNMYVVINLHQRMHKYTYCRSHNIGGGQNTSPYRVNTMG